MKRKPTEGDRLQALRWRRAMGLVVNTEMTDQGEQIVIPGTERSAHQAALARGDKIKPRKPQHDPDGLFDRIEQLEMFK